MTPRPPTGVVVGVYELGPPARYTARSPWRSAVIWLLRGAMCDLMPAGGGLPGLAATDIDGFLQRLWRETTFVNWLGLWLGALFFTLSPVFTVYVPLPSFWLPAGLRARHADTITRAPIYLVRQPIFLLKMYACMCWGQDPQVRARFAIAPYPTDPGTFRTGASS